MDTCHVGRAIKFPFNGIEIIVHGDPNPFQYYNYLRENTNNQVPIKQEFTIIPQLGSVAPSDAHNSTPYMPTTPPL